MINRILVDYLNHNRRIVLPDFGAFIRKDADGKVIFVEYLKRDDNVLSGLVAKTAGVTENQAKIMVRSYISDICRRTEADGVYIIEGLGRMFVDGDGVYQLDHDPAAVSNGAPVTVVVPLAPSPTRVSQQPVQQRREDVAPTPKPSTQPQQQQQAIMSQPIQQTEPAPCTLTTPEPFAEQPLSHSYTPEPWKADSLKDDTRRMERNDVKDLGYQKPLHKTMSPSAPPGNKKRADRVMLIAIVAAVMAILVMLYALLSTSEPRVRVEIDDTPAVVNDSIQ